MERFTSSTWWWEVAFDGIASTLVGVMLGLIGIVVTLRHDRDLAREAEIARECRDIYDSGAEVRDLVGRMGHTTDEVYVAHARWARRTQALADRIGTEYPCLSKLLSACVEAGTSRYEEPGVEHTRRTLDAMRPAQYSMQLAKKRELSPRFTRGMSKERCDDLVAAIRSNQPVDRWE